MYLKGRLWPIYAPPYQTFQLLNAFVRFQTSGESKPTSTLNWQAQFAPLQTRSILSKDVNVEFQRYPANSASLCA